ncbi:hypothetical protein EW093_11160 [Thiospirochaeta perfilievii]|uniref:Lipocalin-like domain-containing protein n=1 Tax=Thiospirochaeta perfilievii TaxID=252967 RepID=A0A5C1QCV7_9SPIO|nr:hypothetical protein [Thiospirochaeta perfilievii]QEN05247.1 hypothetical protein EW093_11160 [Thiospirochaeta perfilievii]
MNNKTLRRGFITPLIALLLLLNSCNLFDNQTTTELSIVGTWLDPSSGGKIEVTSNEYSSYWSNNGQLTQSHKGKITSFENGTYNGSEVETSTGEYGYITIKYDSINGGAGAGKYGILRWKSLITDNGVTTMSYSEGYNSGTYFETEAEAKIGMTDEANYFNFYSTTTKE